MIYNLLWDMDIDVNYNKYFYDLVRKSKGRVLVKTELGL